MCRHETLQDPEPDRRRHLRPRLPRRPRGDQGEGRGQDYEEEVQQLGRGYGSQRGTGSL